MKRQPTRIVCLGGSYVALFLVRRLRKSIRKGDVEVTVISRDNFHVFHGFVGEMLAGRIQPEQVLSPARRVFAPARFFNAEIESVDLERKMVLTSRLLDGRQYEVPYDHLVVSVGSADDLGRYPGVEEHALRLKSYWDCFKTRGRLMSMLEMAEIEPDPEERRRLLTLVVVGGNFGGIEVAAEMLDAYRSLARKEYPNIDPEEVRVVVVHGGARILPELMDTDPKLVEYAEEFLEEVGLEIRTSTRVTAATPEEAVLGTGERISTRTIISCAGTTMPQLVKDMALEKGEGGRIAVQPSGQVVGQDHIWAGGDCGAMPHPNGGACPQVAIYAMAGGWHIGGNILRTIRGQNLKPYRFSGLGDAASLGHNRAVYHLKGLSLRGRFAWALWRLTFLAFAPSLEMMLRVVSDWFVSAVVGRNITNVHVREPYGIQKERYEAGQDIIRQGDIGQRVYVIWDGEVDVVQTQPDGTEVKLACLGPGQHFGETAVFENVRRTATVRARTPTEVLSLGHSATLALSNAMTPFGETIRQLPRTRLEPRGAPSDAS